MSLTRLVVTTLVIVLGIYDLVMVVTGGVDASVSRYFSGLSTYPGIVFVIGYICGHFFGWMTPTLPAGVRARLSRIRKKLYPPQLVTPATCREISKELGAMIGEK